MVTNEAERRGALVSRERRAPVDDKYRRALARLAADAGLAPVEFERRITAAAAKLRLTPECVTLEEIELFPTLASLPPVRQAHVAACAECTRFLNAISPQEGEVAAFVKNAISSEMADPDSIEQA